MMSTQFVSEPVGHVFMAACKNFDTIFSRECGKLFRKESFAALLKKKFVHSDYHDIDLFRRDYFISSFLSKYKGFDLGIDLRGVAYDKFKKSEEVCKTTNERFLSSNRSFDDGVLFDASRIIAKILGVFKWDRVIDGCGWGPGATFELPRRKALLDQKISDLPMTVTASALTLFECVLRDDLHWSSVILEVSPHDISGPFCFIRREVFKIVEGNRLTTVSKNAKSDRVIAIEPRGNGFLQKGFGKLIRGRLKRFAGIDLNSQAFNQDAAKRAYDYALATLDLENASDSVSTELVRDLLPVDWFIALDSVRSKRFLLEGVWNKSEKFSSMGNGFTFELETLLFFGIAEACRRRTSRRDESTLVYGDDIIVPRESAPLTIENLAFAGFTLNKDKSFCEGYFYESCGRHYFKGGDVTPIYQKEIVYGNTTEAIRLCNRVLRCAMRWGDSLRLYDVLERPWRAAFRFCDKLPFYLPQGTEGDDGILQPREFTEWRYASKCINRGLKCKVLVEVLDTIPAHSSALLAHALRLNRNTKPNKFGPLVSEPLPCGRGDDISRSTTKHKIGHRWVMPTSDFALAWT